MELGDQERLHAQAAEHWAFAALKRADAPRPQAGASGNAIDALVRARVLAGGLEPSPRADRRVLIRRLYFDMLGLPPSMADVEAFVADGRPDAWERLVDRVLADPAYGERWGRHWLDVARYADTAKLAGVQDDERYPYAYTYRDYVIDAFNHDIPYDQFVREQLAADYEAAHDGDPALRALGFITVGPRVTIFDQLDDRVDVTSRAFLGLTAACARCHDHMFEPVTMRDYYALTNIFFNAKDPEPSEYPVVSGPGIRQVSPAVKADYAAARAAEQTKIDAYIQKFRDKGLEDFAKRPAAYLEAALDVTENRRNFETYFRNKGLLAEMLWPLKENLQSFSADARWRDDAVFGPLVRLFKVGGEKFDARLDAVRKLAERDPDALHPLVREIVTSESLAAPADLIAAYGKLIADALGDNSDDHEHRAAIRLAVNDAAGPLYPDDAGVRRAIQFDGPARGALIRLEDGLNAVDVTHPGAPPRAMIVRDADNPANTPMLLRGDPTRPGPLVTRHFFSVFDGGPDKPFTQGSGRHELARAITDTDSRAGALAARVFANRIFMHHFGQSLVDDPSDFGLQSRPPSHPELLEFLAARLIDTGWAVKPLHRLILLSETYQQSADYTHHRGHTIDPGNTLLWRQNRRRLELEAMRDAMLAVSGSLDRQLGGRSFSLEAQPFEKRRSVYAFVDRASPDPVLATFDVPSPDASASMRTPTTVPLQALYTMNHPFVAERARDLIAQTPAPSPSAVDDLYTRLFQRTPTAMERDLALAFIADAQQAPLELHTPWQYGFGPPDAALPPAERFTPFAFDYENRRYIPAPKHASDARKWMRLDEKGGTPGNRPEEAVIRRWTAPVAGTLRIFGGLSHDGEKGDGVQATILAGRGGVLATATANNEKKVAVNHRGYIVQPGETIDFIVDRRNEPGWDGFEWTIVIEYIDTPDPGDPPRFHTRENFTEPPPEPLNAWEQYAQALMLTNEFVYVD